MPKNAMPKNAPTKPKKGTIEPETVAVAKDDRLSIRTNPHQKEMLASAARARHMNVSQFVLQASLREAEQVVREERVVVSPDEYAWLSKVMDEAIPAPRLREALKQRSVWDA